MHWKPVHGYEGIYEVSDRGDVRRIPRSQAHPESNRPLKPWLSDTGYHSVTLYRNGRPKKFKVHRLVAAAFLPGPQPGQEVCHNDGDRLHNAAANLRWGTRSENMQDAVRHGTQFNHFRDRTHCANGHEFTEENTLQAKDGRRCRTCRKNRVRAWRERQKEAAAA